MISNIQENTSLNINLSADETCLFAEAVWMLSQHNEAFSLRRLLLEKISRLLRADFGASYIMRSRKKVSETGHYWNISEKVRQDYEHNWQGIEPVTGILSHYRYPICVSDVFQNHALESIDFYHHFLQPNGMEHGINVFFSSDNQPIGDFRMWRSGKNEPFSIREKKILSVLYPYMHRALMSHHEQKAYKLTQKEKEVTKFIKKGFQDKEIARLMNISVTTVRTHIQHIYKKVNCSNRTELVLSLS